VIQASGITLARTAPHTKQEGQSLVELLVTLLLGLVVASSAAAIFVGHRQTNALIEGMSRLTENERFAVELLSREIRDAGSTPCSGLKVPASNTNNVPSPSYWVLWGNGMLGEPFGKGSPVLTAPAGGSSGQVANTNSVLIWTANGTNKPNKIVFHDTTKDQFTTFDSLSPTAGNIYTACDGKQILTVQVNASSGTTVPYQHVTSISAINPGGFLSPLVTNVWYIGNTNVGTATTALRRLQINGDGSSGSNDEMVRDVSDMQISYLEQDTTFPDPRPTTANYVSANNVVNWDRVTAVRVTLTFSTSDSVGNSGSISTKLSHPITFTVALKSRLGVGA